MLTVIDTRSGSVGTLDRWSLELCTGDGVARDEPGDRRRARRRSNGVWMLTVIDTCPGSVGTLDGWSLELTSRMD